MFAALKVLAAVWATVKPQGLTERLVDLLVARDRLPLLRGIAEAYAEAWNERRGFVAAEAVSALPLSAAQQELVVAEIAAFYHVAAGEGSTLKGPKFLSQPASLRTGGSCSPAESRPLAIRYFTCWTICR